MAQEDAQLATETDDNTGCMYNYVVSAQKPTAVNFSCVGHFTSASDINLVVGYSPPS